MIANRPDDLPSGPSPRPSARTSHPAPARSAGCTRPCVGAGAGRRGGLLLGCDLPLVPPALVARLATGFDAARPTVPASPGPLGMEPLCACYPVSLAAAAERWVAAGRFGMGEFVHAHDPVVVARDQLASVAGANTPSST